MQLKYQILSTLLAFSTMLAAQTDTTGIQLEADKPIEIDFLFSYYEQDGNNSPVTGGIGTEQLTDLTPKIILKVPLNKELTLQADGGLDYYTSASTDNINSIMSSASRSDIRIHGNIGLTRSKDGWTYGLRVGGSGEYDYTSVIVGGNVAKTSNDGNREIGLSAQAFFDSWSLIYPAELRRNGQLVNTNLRRSYNLSLTYSQVINQKMQASISLEGVYMTGLLSTPFHRVYFQEQTQAKVEQLPNKRLKVPIGIRFNYAISDQVLARLYYRHYRDDWGVRANTINLEVPIKLNRFFSVYPFVRLHQQTAADYFAPHKEHTLDQVFYTSDYDLAATNSQTFGMGIHFSPVNGLGRVKIPFTKNNKVLLWKGIDLRYGHFQRSTGLKANIISLGMKFFY